MATKISVESASIEKVSKSIKQEAENYKTIYEKIYSIVDDIFGYEQWLGKDARKYNEKIQGFRDNFKKLYNNFISYVNFLAKAAEAYDVAQDTAQGKAGNLTSRY